MNLHNKVAVVLGASSGIGEGISRALAEQQPRGLVLAARRKENLEALAQDLHAHYGTDTLVVPTDVTSPEQLHSLVQQTLSKYNRLDIFVNSAGVIQQETPIDSLSPDTIAAIIGTNLTQNLIAAHYVLPCFKQQGNGTLITLSSMAGKIPYAGESAYCGSKGGLDHAVRALDEEFKSLRQQGAAIYIFALGPGFIDTAEARRNFPNVGEDVWSKAPKSIDFGRIVVAYALDPATKYQEKGPVVHIETISA